MRVMTLNFEDDVTFSLESQMSRLTLESSVTGNVIDTFKNTVPLLAESLFTQFKSLSSDKDDELKNELIEAKLVLGKLKVKLPHASYLNQTKTLVSVPEGFKGNLLDYVNTLTGMSVELFQEANKTLGEYNFVLSAFITNKENKISLKDHTDLFLRIKARREKLTEEIAHYFPKNNDLSKAYLGEVIHRFADLEVLVTGVDRLNVQRKQQNIKDVSDSVKKCLDLLKVVIDDSKNNGMVQVSGAAAMNISNGAYEIGKYVEFIALYRFRVEQVVSTVEKLLKTLDSSI